jgi:hypothetical protein
MVVAEHRLTFQVNLRNNLSDTNLCGHQLLLCPPLMQLYMLLNFQSESIDLQAPVQGDGHRHNIQARDSEDTPGRLGPIRRSIFIIINSTRPLAAASSLLPFSACLGYMTSLIAHCSLKPRRNVHLIVRIHGLCMASRRTKSSIEFFCNSSRYSRQWPPWLHR